jgi:hypothetical protein
LEESSEPYEPGILETLGQIEHGIGRLPARPTSKLLAGMAEGEPQKLDQWPPDRHG